MSQSAKSISSFTTRRIATTDVLLATIVGLAADAQSAPPAFAPVDDDPNLPRVLLLGDSISIGYTVSVRKLLAGKANVHRPAANCGPTSRGLESIDQWLGDGKWDAIHFNWGLHDLKYIGDARQVPPEQYEQNLRRLVERLKQTGATLIWCNTTPVPEGCTPRRHNDDVLHYNALAAKIMQQHEIAVDDLYDYADQRLDDIQLPRNVHFTRDGSAVLAKQVAGSIEAALKNE